MNWLRIIEVALVAGLLVSMTDWIFAGGDWLHRRYSHSETWRLGAEGRAIAQTSPLPFLTCGSFAFLYAWLGLHSFPDAFRLAMAVWLIAPLPLILTTAAFVKLHHVFVISFVLSWLLKLIIAAAIAGLLLH
jgi:hypothetical protein